MRSRFFHRSERSEMRTLVTIAALVASLEVYAGHWADQNGQCLDEGGEPTACKWGQMYWGDGQTYSPPIVAPQVDANADGSEDIRITLLNLMQGSQNGWSAVTYFRVECDGLPVQIISADNPRLTGLEPETTYSCLIYAGNDLGLGDQAGQFTVTTDAESGGGLPVWVIWAALNPTDPYFSNVVLLLNAEETGAAQDQSSFNHEVSLQDNATISPTSKFGEGAYEFDGNLDYISLPISGDLDLGSSDWTIELWLSTSGAVASYNYVFDTPHTQKVYFLTDNSVAAGYENKLDVAVHDAKPSPTDPPTAQIIADVNVNDGSWHFIAICRSNDSIMLWSDGQLAGEAVMSDPLVSASFSGGRIGRYINDASYNHFSGLIDEFRVTAGVCRYSGNFSPPTRAFPTR